MPWLRINSAAEYADISPRLLRDWLNAGLRHSKVGGAVLIKDEWVDEFIEAAEVKQESSSQAVDRVVDEVLADI